MELFRTMDNAPQKYRQRNNSNMEAGTETNKHGTTVYWPTQVADWIYTTSFADEVEGVT
jgi:hypothetical protein